MLYFFKKRKYVFFINPVLHVSCICQLDRDALVFHSDSFQITRVLIYRPSFPERIANFSLFYFRRHYESSRRCGGVHREIRVARRKPEATRSRRGCRRPCPCRPRFEGSLTVYSEERSADWYTREETSAAASKLENS